MKFVLLIASSFLLLGCGAEEAGCGGSTITLEDKQGVSFSDCFIQSPGTFKNSDLYVTYGEPYLKVSTGGPDSVHTMPSEWNVPKTYESLGSVPDTLPLEGSVGALIKAKTGTGFVIKNHTTSGYTKGWIENGEPNTGFITIQFEALVD